MGTRRRTAARAVHHGAIRKARMHQPANVALEYEVTRKGEDNGVILSGRTSIDARHEATIEHNARDHEELRFAAHERNDGTFDVEMKYREVAPDGSNIKWLWAAVTNRPS
jgi:hypothetical protein